jgi:hypothetical protein
MRQVSFNGGLADSNQAKTAAAGPVTDIGLVLCGFGDNRYLFAVFAG